MLCHDSKWELTLGFPFHSDVGHFAFATGRSDAVLAALRKFFFNASQKLDILHMLQLCWIVISFLFHPVVVYFRLLPPILPVICLLIFTADLFLRLRASVVFQSLFLWVATGIMNFCLILQKFFSDLLMLNLLVGLQPREYQWRSINCLVIKCPWACRLSIANVCPNVTSASF